MSDLSKNKVLLGLSGGVDSTTAALLLQGKGYEVTGLYFDINEQGTIKDEKPKKAQLLANQLGIEFIYKNAYERFNEIVIGNFCNEYSCGRTPNPCIICNPNIKFKILEEEANKIGAYHIATGHYAQTEKCEIYDKTFIVQGENIRKDQSYMLYRLGEEIVKRIIFPLGNIDDKETVRNLARENCLPNANAKDSQEICFVDDNKNYVSYLLQKGVEKGKGEFRDLEDNVLGYHKGVEHYTIGQRKGLGITFGKPTYVVKIDGANNIVYLGENKDIFTHEITIINCFFRASENNIAHPDFLRLDLKGKIRYSSIEEKCKILYSNEKETKILFENPQRAATPGQSVVLYYDNIVIGGGFIK